MEELIASLNFVLYVLNNINPGIERYNTAREVFNALKMLLNNQKICEFTKKDMETAMDVLKEIKIIYAKNEDEKLYYEVCTEYCKQMVQIQC